MKNEATATLRGPLLVSETQLREAYALAEDVRNSDPRAAKSGGLQSSLTSVILKLKDGQKYTLDNCDDIFRIDNRRKNPVVSVQIQSGLFGSNTAKIELRSEWYTEDGAEIEVSGPVERNQQSLSRFHRIFDVDKDLFLTTMSAPAWLIALSVTFLAHAGVGLLSRANISDIMKSEIVLVFGYILIFWLTPTMFLTLGINLFISKKLGRVIFLWDGGLPRYESKRKIILFFMYTLPVAVVGKYVAALFGVA